MKKAHSANNLRDVLLFVYFVWILRDHFVGVHANWLYSVTKWRSSSRFNGRWFTHSIMNFDYWNSTVILFLFKSKSRKVSHWHFLTAGGKTTTSFIYFNFYYLFFKFSVDANYLTHQLFIKHFGAMNEWMNQMAVNFSVCECVHVLMSMFVVSVVYVFHIRNVTTISFQFK